MKSLQSEVRDELERLGIEYVDKAKSFHAADIEIGQQYGINIELKEKRQKYREDKWDTNIPQLCLFILDDLSARKIVSRGINSYLLVRDTSTAFPAYYLFTIMDLVCMPKKRCNREMMCGNKKYIKGKWLIDLRDGIQVEPSELWSVIHGMWLTNSEWLKSGECYGSYEGESIPVMGSTRTNYQRSHDLKVTR